MKYFALVFLFVSGSLVAEIDLVKVDKSENKMFLMEEGKVIKRYHVAFGANPKGQKKQEGDERTPEGFYVLDYKKEDSSFYRAMHINYPNEKDSADAKKNGISPGGFIMVHGQRNWLGWFSFISQRFNWTNGCIALSNSEIDEFMEKVKVGTPISIEW